MKVLLAIAGLFVAALAVSAQSVPKDWLVSLERTGCVGTCPVYKIEIDSGGTVTFRNRHNEITKDKLSVCHIQELYKLSETEQFLNSNRITFPNRSVMARMRPIGPQR